MGQTDKQGNDGTPSAARCESLGGFFEDLGLNYFLNGRPIGSYCLDWGHIELSNLDRLAKSYSQFELFRSEFDPRRGDCGPTGHPSFICKGTTYVFRTALFSDNCFWLELTMTYPDGSSEDKFWTLEQLRMQMGVPFFPELQQELKYKTFGLLERLAGLLAPTYIVRAKQVWRSDLTSSTQPKAIAKVEISDKKSGQKLHSDLINYPMLVGSQTLLMQLFMLATEPAYQYPEWQKLMEQLWYVYRSFEPSPEIVTGLRESNN